MENNLSKKDKKFISALVFAGVGVVLLGVTYSVEMAVYRIHKTMNHNSQMDIKVKSIQDMHKALQDNSLKNQGFKPLKEVIKDDHKKRQINNKPYTKEVL